MKILHVLIGGIYGGVEKLCIDIGKIDRIHNDFLIIKKNDNLYNRFIDNQITCFTVLDDEKFSFSSLDIVYKYIINLDVLNKYDAVIFHHINLLTSLLSKKIKKRLSVKVFAYAHAAYEDIMNRNSKKYFLNYLCLKKALKRIDGIFCISNYVLKSFDSNIKSNKYILNYNGIDKNDILEKNNSFDSNLIRFVYVGRLIEKKGVQNIISYLSRIHLNYTFDIIGEGPYKEELMKKVNDYGVNASFLGYQSNVLQLLKNYDVFIHLPNWEEGFGISIIEAMASGLVVFANTKGALPEIIKDSINGYLVDNFEDFDMKLTNMLRDTNTYFNVVKNAKLSAKDFSIDNTLNTIMKEVRK